MGKWNEIETNQDGNIMNATNLYMLPDGSGKGDATFLSQCNMRTEHTHRKYRKDLLREIKDFVQEINTEKEIIISGCYNQHIGANETQQFYREIGVQDILSGHEKNRGTIEMPCSNMTVDALTLFL